MELDDPEVSAPQAVTSAGRAGDALARAEEGARFAEESQARASDVMEFLSSPEALRRMVCTRVVLEPFRIVKSNMLSRDGGGMGDTGRHWLISRSIGARWQRHCTFLGDDNGDVAQTVGGVRWVCCFAALHHVSLRSRVVVSAHEPSRRHVVRVGILRTRNIPLEVVWCLGGCFVRRRDCGRRGRMHELVRSDHTTACAGISKRGGVADQRIHMRSAGSGGQCHRAHRSNRVWACIRQAGKQREGPDTRCEAIGKQR